MDWGRGDRFWASQERDLPAELCLSFGDVTDMNYGVSVVDSRVSKADGSLWSDPMSRVR